MLDRTSVLLSGEPSLTFSDQIPVTPSFRHSRDPEAAIISFQTSTNIAATGALDPTTVNILKRSAAGKLIAGTWTGTTFLNGVAIGHLTATWLSDVTALLTYDYLPCTGTATYLDFDGVHLRLATQNAPITTPSCNQAGSSVATFTSPTTVTVASVTNFGSSTQTMTRTG